MDSLLYSRGPDSYLMVLSGSRIPLEEVARLVFPFGQVEAIHAELDVIQVHVDHEKFIEGSVEKLTNRDDPAFYELNKRELESIDLQRVERAVQRLSAAEPKIYRTDISRRLISLLNEEGVTFYGDLSRALIRWRETQGVAGKEAAKLLERLTAQKKDIPRELVELLAAEKETSVVPTLHVLWLRDATQWESPYGEMGPAIEPYLLEEFPKTEGSLRHSTVRLLGQVGGPSSLPVLEAAKRGANSELQVQLADSIRRIRERQAR